MPLTLAAMLDQPGDGRSLRIGVAQSHSASTQTTTVVVDGNTPLVLPCARGLAPVAGDAVVIGRARHTLVVLAVLGPAPAAPPSTDPLPRPPDPTTVTVTLSPTATGSARGGSWRGDTDRPTQGDWTGRGVNFGAAFYRRPPAGVVESATVRIRRADGGVFAAQTPTLRLLAQSAPTGSPTTVGAALTGPALAIGQDAAVTLPASWGQTMVDGGAGGLGVYVAGASPYIVTHGRGTWSPAWTLTLRIRTEG